MALKQLLTTSRLYLIMHISRLLLIFLLLISVQFLDAQQVLKGKVYDTDTDSVLAGVNIFNNSKKISARSTPGGNYGIAAEEGDVLIFSISGYKADTVKVRFDLLITQYDPGLQRQVISLQGVKVTTNYQSDSLNRHNYYNDIYAKQPGITGRNRPDNGLGITVSPLSFLARESKQKRTLRKRLEKQEKEFFIDQSFPLAWVKSLTGLSGDSLSLFMYRYRPTYTFCRTTDRQGMRLYVNEKMKEFRRSKAEKSNTTTESSGLKD